MFWRAETILQELAHIAVLLLQNDRPRLLPQFQYKDS